MDYELMWDDLKSKLNNDRETLLNMIATCTLSSNINDKVEIIRLKGKLEGINLSIDTMRVTEVVYK